MAAKKRSTTAEKDLKKTVKKLRAQLDRSDAKADKWKKKAGKLEKATALSDARVKKLTKQLEKTSSSPVVAPIPAVAEPTETAAETTQTTESSGAGPNPDWTVVQLRAEARSRGLTGLSGKSKAQLLEALS